MPRRGNVYNPEDEAKEAGTIYVPSTSYPKQNTSTTKTTVSKNQPLTPVVQPDKASSKTNDNKQNFILETTGVDISAVDKAIKDYTDGKTETVEGVKPLPNPSERLNILSTMPSRIEPLPTSESPNIPSTMPSQSTQEDLDIPSTMPSEQSQNNIDKIINSAKVEYPSLPPVSTGTPMPKVKPPKSSQPNLEELKARASQSLLDSENTYSERSSKPNVSTNNNQVLIDMFKTFIAGYIERQETMIGLLQEISNKLEIDEPEY